MRSGAVREGSAHRPGGASSSAVREEVRRSPSGCRAGQERRGRQLFVSSTGWLRPGSIADGCPHKLGVGARRRQGGGRRRTRGCLWHLTVGRAPPWVDREPPKAPVSLWRQGGPESGPQDQRTLRKTARRGAPGLPTAAGIRKLLVAIYTYVNGPKPSRPSRPPSARLERTRLQPAVPPVSSPRFRSPPGLACIARRAARGAI